MNKVLPEIAAFHDDIISWRQDIHAHPELGFEENRTADLVAEKLEEFGLEVYRGIGKTGVVASLRVGNSPRAIGLRADMDALPILEANDFSYKSVNEGKMHACGHDGHTAMLLGAAKYLAASRNFEGAVHFIFQPAEEGLGGAEAMVKDGLFEQFPMDAVFGIHNRPGLATGKFAIRKGPMMAGGALFDLEIEGKGSHAARPESGVDPVVIAAHITTAWQTIVARNMSPQAPVVLTVAAIHAGEAYNVVPQKASMKGTVRAFSSDILKDCARRMENIARGIAESMGASIKFDYRTVFLPVINSEEETDFAVATAAELVGEDNINTNPALVMGSEDFSFMLDACPGAYINIGNGEDKGSCELHNHLYDFNDEISALGASYFARLVERMLEKDAA